MTSYLTNRDWIRPGSVVSTWVWTPYPVFHKGIATDRFTDDGEQLIISASKKLGRVAFERRAAFGVIEHIEYPSREHPDDVLDRAERELNSPWRLFDANCEHFVRRAHRLDESSPQVQGALLLTFFLGLAAASRS